MISFERGEGVYILHIGKLQIMACWKRANPEKAEGNWAELSFVWW